MKEKKSFIATAIVLALTILLIFLYGCGKSQLTPIESVKYVQFGIKSDRRFNAVHGVNDAIIDKYVYTTDYISGRYSVKDNDTLFVNAYSNDPSQEYVFTILYDGEVLVENNKSITLIF